MHDDVDQQILTAMQISTQGSDRQIAAGYGRMDFDDPELENMKRVMLGLAHSPWFDEEPALQSAFIKVFQVWGGYPLAKMFKNGSMAYAHRLLFHWTVAVTHPVHCDVSVDDRWCFDDKRTATIALHTWNGEGDMPDGWHRHNRTGRRREGGDPSKEIIRR